MRTPGETAAGPAMAIAPRHYWIRARFLTEGRRRLGDLLAAGDGEAGRRTHTPWPPTSTSASSRAGR
ncbi:hypothetical protein [Streptomyces sp. NPDC046976]|uniref:hypothetical protein n=1 Tax=Streptomyces sp. NPDC046976 TaxID=3155258 RepID=UPI0033CC82EF